MKSLTVSEKTTRKIKAIKQPIITPSEINKMVAYSKKIQDDKCYSPWMTVRQSKTHGQGQILTSHKCDHIVHLLSLGELYCFLELEHNPQVTAIFEQFPLDLTETIAIAEKLSIFHPANYKERAKFDNKIPAKTMTTDFVVREKTGDGREIITPYNFKYGNSLDPAETSERSVRRTQDKIKIETYYWSNKSNGLCAINESFFSEAKTYNLLYLRQCFNYPDYIDVACPLYLNSMRLFKERFPDEQNKSLKDVIVKVANTIGIHEFHAECIFKHAAYQGFIEIDWTQKIELWLPLSSKIVANSYAY